MAQTQDDSFSPYKLFFPLGVFCAVLGVGLWILFQVRAISFFPRMAHGQLMFFGFLWSFIAGFLMTAVPKMTATAHASYAEMFAPFAMVVLQIVFNIRNETNLTYVCLLVQNLALLFFLIRRLKSVQKIPFWGFIFIPTAFVILMIGLVMSFFFKDQTFMFILSGEAFVLNLILGLGSRLIPVISRLPNSLMPNQISEKKSVGIEHIGFLIFLNASYFIQLFLDYRIGVTIRLILLGYAMIKYFRIFDKPMQKTVVGFGLKMSLALFFISHIFLLLSPVYSLAAAHVLYIGGFSLLTLLIATRVILAHGGQTLEYEVSSKRTVFILVLLAFSSLGRYLIGANITSAWLLAVVALFIVAILIWISKFIQIEF